MSGETGLTVEQAREAILASAADLGPLPEAVTTSEALGRTLAIGVTASTDLPPFDSAAMDGIAALPATEGQALEVIGESRAGSPFRGTLLEGQAIRISTGAAAPEGTGVAPVETIAFGDGDRTARLRGDLGEGDHVRRAGEDIRRGELALPPGTVLGPGELAVAAACGIEAIECARRPSVAIVATGDELVAPGDPLGPGQIHESNSVMLAAAATRAGAEVTSCSRSADSPAATLDALSEAIACSDFVLASGGVSVGEHDHVRPALTQLGVEEIFWRVRLKPGGPTWFGRAENGTLVFGLPGNPASAFVTFRLFAVPAIRRALGLNELPPRLQVALSEPVRRGTREQAVRVALESGQGGFRARPTGAQGSHRTASLSGAWGLAFIPEGDGSLAVGDEVAVEPLHDPVGIGRVEQ